MPDPKKPAAAKKTKKATAGQKAAKKIKPVAASIAHGDCAAIRAAVDGVLSNASGGQIQPSTPGDRLLSLFIIPDKIQFLHIRLNEALNSHQPFTPFTSSEIKASSSVGEVRTGASKHCGADCPP